MGIESPEEFDHEANGPSLEEVSLGSRRKPPWVTGRLPILTKAETDRLFAIGELRLVPKSMDEVNDGDPTNADVREHNRQAIRKAQHEKQARGAYDWQDESGNMHKAPPGKTGVSTTESMTRGGRQPACSRCGAGTGIFTVRDSGELVCAGGCSDS